MKKHCIRCNMDFETEDLAISHTLLVHTDDWYRLFKGEKIVNGHFQS
jgi:hypothetical protein